MTDLQPGAWIPCSERMPEGECGKEPLVLCLHQHPTWPEPGYNVSLGKWCDTGEGCIWYDENDDMQDWELVTHWMPIPPPPALKATAPKADQ